MPRTDHVAVHDFGGDGPTVLYAHATGFHAHCWTSVTAHLPRLHNIAYDARGHGDTPLGPEWSTASSVDWSVYGRDAAEVAASVQDDGPVVGVGHSMGGAALLMAALEAPQLFRGLVLYEPIAMPPAAAPPAGQGNNLAAGARKRRSSFPSFEHAIANYSAKPPMNVFTAETMDAYVRHGFAAGDDGQVHLKCAPEHEARTYEAGGTHDTWDRLGDVSVPVWVVCGIPEPMQPSARAAEMASRIPQARYIEIGHLGHFGPMQSPLEIATISCSAPAAATTVAVTPTTSIRRIVYGDCSPGWTKPGGAAPDVARAKVRQSGGDAGTSETSGGTLGNRSSGA